MTHIILPTYPPKVSHKKGTVIAKPGDKCKLIAKHDTIWIVELKNGERISIRSEFLIEIS